MKDLKYLLAYIVPVVVFLSIHWGGPWSFLSVYVLFGVAPFLELFMKGTTENHSLEKERILNHSRLFDYLLYANLPIQYGLLGYFLYSITYRELMAYEYIGMTVSMGIACGSLGINVAHELGHRHKKYEQWMAQALLLSSLYMHFFIEHNRGHHKYVATPKDPATSFKGQNLYAFWWRSITKGYMSAWKLENQRLMKTDTPIFSAQNLMLKFQLTQLLFIVVIGFTFGGVALLAFLGAALIGILELETVNYLEHYGLLRKELKEGVYERVQPHHSWNTNRTIGRILLYELTRHSDHHYLASRKYQVLRHFEESPELPSGYPGMMMLALIPPLWFRVMDRELNKKNAAEAQRT